MYNEDESMVLVYNGEIYNFQQIREDLLDKGTFSAAAPTRRLFFTRMKSTGLTASANSSVCSPSLCGTAGRRCC